MRILKFRNQFNWKYIFGEILLIFVGINLAIWFNNWNASIKSNKEKEIAIAKIKDELQSNISELNFSRKANKLTFDAYSEFKKIYHTNSNEIITTPEHLNLLQNKYPNFYTVLDSSNYEPGIYLYEGTTYINLELPELSQIAWETTRSINTSNEFEYECLYELESMYNLQKRVEKEIEKAANALQKKNITELMNILEFTHQFNIQLEKDYQNMLINIDNCR